MNEKDKSMWDRISENLGDFAENYLWGVGETKSDRKEFFKKKYGDDWEGKYQSAKKNVRSMYGLIPQTSGQAKKDAVLQALTVLIAKRPSGIQLFRGVTKPHRDMIRHGKLSGGDRYEGNVFTQQSPFISSGYQESFEAAKIAESHVAGLGWAPDRFMNKPISGIGELIEFDIPRSFMDKWARGGSMWRQYGRIGEKIGEKGAGKLIPGAREVEIRRSIPEDYITRVTPSSEIIRSKLPEIGLP